MFYKDLSNYCYHLKVPVCTVKNVGWLEAGRDFRVGKVCCLFLPKLSSIILGNSCVNAQVNRLRSAHHCALSTCGSQEVTDGERKDTLGVSELWIPSTREGEFFAAPSMIYHYIEGHDYLPPGAFIDSVMAFDLTKPYQAQRVYLNAIGGHF